MARPLSPLTIEEYRSLPRDVRLERGRAAERYRRSFYHTRAYQEISHRAQSGHARCDGCGTADDLTIDHIHPIILGGTHEASNLRFLCGSCNSRKGMRP